jgi:glucokinase
MSDPRAALGIDIGGTTTKLAIVRSDGSIGKVESGPTLERGDPDVFIPWLLDRVRCALRADRKLDGIGVAVAGLLDERRDRLVYNPNIEPLEQFPLTATLESEFHLPVRLEVDSNAACLAEALYGAGTGFARVLSLAVGTGLGGGMTVNGSLMRIAYECIGDAGHMILDPDGPECGAGCHGCAEALVSAPALEQRASQRIGRKVTAREVIEAARSGDAEAAAALAETGEWLGLAMASLGTVFFPDCIVISGGISEAGDLLLGPAERAFRRVSAPFMADRVTVRRACLGWQATLIGGAAGVWS